MLKKYSIFFVWLVLIVSGTTVGIYYKNRMDLVKKNETIPYLTLIGPVDAKKESEKNIGALGRFLAKTGGVNIISDRVNPNGLPHKVIKMLKKNDRRLGKIVVFEPDEKEFGQNVSVYLPTITQENQLRIAYSKFESTRLPQDRVMQLNMYFDAVLVSDPFFVGVYERSGVKIPVFSIPESPDLQDFLNKPLKNSRNPVFLFGNTGQAVDRNNQIMLVRAFAKAFGNVKDVALHINCEEGDEETKQGIAEEVLKSNCSNIFFTEVSLKRDAYVQFLSSMDCYVSLSKGESYAKEPREAMALGIPVILCNNTAQTTVCNSGLVEAVRSAITEPVKYFGSRLFAGVQFNCEPEEAAFAMKKVFSNYEEYLARASKARAWVSSRDSVCDLYKSLVHPKRIVLGHKNEVHPDFLITKSKQLYAKYRSLDIGTMPSSPPLSFSTPAAQWLTPISLTENKSGVKGIDGVYVINLDARPERWAYAKRCFDEVGVFPNRVSAINGWNIPLKQQIEMTDERAELLVGGALGCLLSHVSIYKDAVERGFDVVWICEDDIVFRDKPEKLSALIEELSVLDPDWDVLYTDYSTKGVGIQNPRPGQAFYEIRNESVSESLSRIHGRYNSHSILFSKKGLDKAYRYFTHTRLWSPVDVDIHYIPGFKEYTVKKDIVSSVNDSSLPALDGTSDTQYTSILNN